MELSCQVSSLQAQTILLGALTQVSEASDGFFEVQVVVEYYMITIPASSYPISEGTPTDFDIRVFANEISEHGPQSQ